jgi:hypothetical protein
MHPERSRKLLSLKREKLAAGHPNEKKPILGERIWLIGGFGESFSRSQHFTYLLRKEFVVYWFQTSKSNQALLDLMQSA